MHRFTFTLITVLVTQSVAGINFPVLNVENAHSFQEIGDTFRLPNNTRPETYEINIRTWIHESNLDFLGSVRIGIMALESTNFITLHHRLLTIRRIAVLSDNEAIPIETATYNSTLEFLTIPISGGNLTAGSRYTVEIEYAGLMHEWSGFFYSSYVNDSGDRVWFGSTQFEATDARRAFPCFDEPALKSNFTIRITHHESYSALSNMPVNSQFHYSDGTVTTEFQQTPPISTYLIAFHISDFRYVESNTSAIPQRVYIRPNALHQTDLALESGELLLDAFAEYLNINYSLPKLDQVGKPAYGGAMEHWGLLTYSENVFLFDKNVYTYGRQSDALLTISHELAHQWFGNLVTPSWWTYLWMKEGFAILFQFIGIDLVNPGWNMIDFFLINNVHYVFQVDALQSALPMTNYVESPYDIDRQYNDIAYSKAASVLRMFMYAFGEDTFMQGVTEYLRANAYSDVTEEYLFDALAISVWLDPENTIPPTVDVNTIMASWTRQPGFPLVSVQRNYDDSPSEVTLSQRRYYNFDTTNPDNSTWWIPYNLATSADPGFENTRAEGWMPQNQTSVTIVVDGLQSEGYLLLNKRATGYYRVLYDERNYKLLSDAIVRNISEFHVTNRAQLFDDALEFHRRGYISYETVMDLLRILEYDDEIITWIAARLLLYTIANNFFGHPNYPIWEDFNRKLSEHLYDTHGIEDQPDEPILRKLGREFVIDWACREGSMHCRSDANRRLRQLITNGTEFHQNVRNVMYCASLWSSNANDFNFVWNRLLASDDITERYVYINSLGCSMSRQMLIEYLRSSLNSTNSRGIEYRQNEQSYVLVAVCNNGHFGFEIALDFLIENAVEAYGTYGATVVLNLGVAAIRPDLTEKYRTFLNILLDNQLINQNSIYIIEALIAQQNQWLATHGQVINQWLLDNHS